MHKLTKITPYIRKEIYNKYREKMQITKWKNKEQYYEELSVYYRVHYNTIRKIIKRWKNWDFSVHKSTIKANLWYKFKETSGEMKEEIKTLSAETQEKLKALWEAHKKAVEALKATITETSTQAEKDAVIAQIKALNL